MADSIITNIAKAKMVKARCGILATMPNIVSVAFGNGAAIGSDIRTPLSTDTALQNELLRQAIDGYSLNDDGISVTYTCTLAKPTLAGTSINEIALCDSDGDLVAIKSFSGKGKDGDMEMEFSIIDTF